MGITGPDITPICPSLKNFFQGNYSAISSLYPTRIQNLNCIPPYVIPQ